MLSVKEGVLNLDRLGRVLPAGVLILLLLLSRHNINRDFFRVRCRCVVGIPLLSMANLFLKLSLNDLLSNLLPTIVLYLLLNLLKLKLLEHSIIVLESLTINGWDESRDFFWFPLHRTPFEHGGFSLTFRRHRVLIEGILLLLLHIHVFLILFIFKSLTSDIVLVLLIYQ